MMKPGIEGSADPREPPAVSVDLNLVELPSSSPSPKSHKLAHFPHYRAKGGAFSEMSDQASDRIEPFKTCWRAKNSGTGWG